MRFKQQFTIHPVGQGLFYSGEIYHQNKVKFRMVFDCGSIPGGEGQKEVSLYRDKDYLDTKILDLLVISHFDKDHVNHLGKLLKDGIKVIKIVMPFVSLAERLFLVLRHLDVNSGFKSENDEFYVNFVIDPIGTLNENIDDRSEIFIIDGEPNDPIPPNENYKEESSSGEEGGRFIFDFDEKDKNEFLSSEFIISNPNGKIKKINHSNTGKLKSNSSTILMEFLFYKRKIGRGEIEFFEKVKELFFKKFEINEGLEKESLLVILTKTIKGITSATKIKKIFQDSENQVGLEQKPTHFDIQNMNTTALCLLHRNLIGILTLTGRSFNDFEDYRRLMVSSFAEIKIIQKFISNSPQRRETHNYYYPKRFIFQPQSKNSLKYPNLILTSDCFLLTEDQVAEFMNHYQHYWLDFWLFQIPHHGSEKSSNKLLFANIPSETFNFVNYGIENKNSHPSPILINDLIATGNSAKLFDVNQFTGLKFGLNINEDY